MENSSWQFATASNIRFGRGASVYIADELQRVRVTRPLIVTDERLVQVDAIRGCIQHVQSKVSRVSVFDRCQAEPAIDVAIAAGQQAMSSGCDSIIGLGGGSCIDVAKIAACILKHGGRPNDYFGFDAIPGPIAPLFAVPTTAGTGSEVSHSAVLTDLESQVKVSTLSRWLRPTAAIVDPSLTDTCPAKVTADSGIDALVHAIEAYTNRSFTEMGDFDLQARAYEGSYPLTQLIAVEAITQIFANLPTAVQQPTNRTARDSMAYAAMLGGMAFSNSGVALVHALEYPIGVLTHCSHGEGNGLLLPHVMRFNAATNPDRYAELGKVIATVANAHSKLPFDVLDREASVEFAINAVVELQRVIGIKTQLRDLGLDRFHLPIVARRTMHIKRLMDINPRTPTETELVAILESAY